MASAVNNSALFQWRVNRASHLKNPLETLLKETNTHSSSSESVSSLFTALIAAIAFGAGGLALYYVITRTPTFYSTDIGHNGVVVVRNSQQAVIDAHHILIPPYASGFTSINLPDASTLDLGRFASFSVPDTVAGTTDDRNAYITFTGNANSYKVEKNTGALFMVAFELGQNKWKLIREWPSDSSRTVGH